MVAIGSVKCVDCGEPTAGIIGDRNHKCGCVKRDAEFTGSIPDGKLANALLDDAFESGWNEGYDFATKIGKYRLEQWQKGGRK